MTGRGEGDERRRRRSHYRSAALFHPLRQAILHLLDGRETGQDQIAERMDETQSRIAYHLRVLVRHGALKARARGPSLPARYRWAPHANWARKMLDKEEE